MRCVVGLDRKSVLVTVVDCVTLYICCARVYVHTADVVSRAIIRMLEPHVNKVKTLTFDNSSEFVRHEKVARSLNAETYFVRPYSSWEHGINENTYGLLRQFFPKKTDCNLVNNQELKNAVAQSLVLLQCVFVFQVGQSDDLCQYQYRDAYYQ